MSFTIQDMMLTAETRYEMKFLAGKNGWSNSISWVHLLEDTTIIQNFWGKELAVTTGLGFPEKEDWMKMKYPTYVKLLINESDKQIAVQACDEHDDKSVQFYKEKSNGVLSVRWNAKDLINTIARICDWDLSQLSYRVNGVLVPEMNLMLFDLNEAVTMV